MQLNFAASVPISISKQPAPLLPPSSTPNLITATHFASQLDRLQLIQDSLARPLVSCHPFLSNLYTGLKLRNRSTTRCFLLLTKSLPPPSLHICMISSLFNLITSLVPQMLSPTLVHLHLPLWTTALSVFLSLEWTSSRTSPTCRSSVPTPYHSHVGSHTSS